MDFLPATSYYGNLRLLLADLEKLKKDGIEHFIHVRSNVLEELRNYQSLLGI